MTFSQTDLALAPLPTFVYCIRGAIVIIRFHFNALKMDDSPRRKFHTALIGNMGRWSWGTLLW